MEPCGRLLAGYLVVSVKMQLIDLVKVWIMDQVNNRKYGKSI